MSHLSHDNTKLIARLRRIKGQVEGVERALEAKTNCTEVLRQIASIRGAMAGLTNELLAEHLLSHVAEEGSQLKREAAANEMIQILKTYLK
ncbi:metal/formaldehyde-sensitive transcriptional repressor [Polycladidibacter stylochi]|uniref:metal/formaldehyde-sensitive transcriptional repressor n=1 Tax=Polycladidibacter stylochi TaxID=1807766 RepID=UPI00082CA732|nr:metal/formaldehyde-sensitive transcriptional repressor [Pseudovibrio stylochi]